MKRYISSLALVLLTASYSFAQEKSATPTAQAKATFKQQFPAATKVKWEKEKGDFEVNFMEKGTEMSAVFSPQGSLKETERTITAAELPEPAKAYLEKNYKGKKIKEAAKITKADASVNYEAKINKTDLLFDASGKFIKVAKD